MHTNHVFVDAYHYGIHSYSNEVAIKLGAMVFDRNNASEGHVCAPMLKANAMCHENEN